MEIGQWFRCNSCFSKQDDKNSPFSLTSCGHIFCNACVSSGSKCLYCKTENISSMFLTDSVSSQVKYIFKPLEDSFEKLQLGFIFQKTQSQITLQRLVELEKLYAQISTEYLNVYQENEVLRAKLKYIQENLNKCQQYFIAEAVATTSSTSENSASAKSNEIQRNMVFYKPSNFTFQLAQPNNGMTSLTPPNQRLQTVRMTPGIMKKSKEKKLISKVYNKKN